MITTGILVVIGHFGDSINEPTVWIQCYAQQLIDQVFPTTCWSRLGRSQTWTINVTASGS